MEIFKFIELYELLLKLLYFAISMRNWMELPILPHWIEY